MWITSGVRTCAAVAGTTTAMTASSARQCGQRWMPFAAGTPFGNGGGTL